MGWVWKNDDGGDGVNQVQNSSPRSSSSDHHCSTRRIVRSQCKTEEVEPGKFIRKCEKTEELLKDCVGRPSEVVQSEKEYTEEDVTDQVVKGSFPLGVESSQHGSFDFPGLRSDIEAIERNIFGGVSRFFQAAEEMRNGFLGAFGAPHIYESDSSSSSSTRRGIPIEDHPQKEASRRASKSDGQIDLSELAKDV